MTPLAHRPQHPGAAHLVTALEETCSRCLTPIVAPISRRHRRRGAALDRHRHRRAGRPRRRAGRAAPGRSPRARPERTGARGDLPRRADCATVPPRLPRPLPGRAASTSTPTPPTTTTTRLDPRLAALADWRGRPSPPPGRRPAGRITTHGSSEATRLACPPGRSARAPRADGAAARGVPALPPAEAGPLTPARTAAGTAAARRCASRRKTKPRAARPEARARTPAPRRRPWTSPRLSPADRRAPPAASASPSTRWAATTRPRRSLRGAVDWARAHPDDGRHPRRRRGADRGPSSTGALPANVEHRPGEPSRSRMDEHPAAGRAAQARREHQRLHAPRARRRGRRRRHRRPHRRRASRRPSSTWAACRASTARPWPSRWSPTAGRSCCSTSAPRPTRRASTSTSTRSMGTIFAEQVLGVPDPIGRAAVASARKAARASSASRRRPSCSQASDLHFVGNVEGKDLPHASGRRGRLRRLRRQRHDQVLRGPVELHLRPCCATEFERPPLGPDRLPLHAPGHRAHPPAGSTTSGSAARRCSASRAPCSSPTAGRKRRMIGFAVEVGAAAARARIPDRIADGPRRSDADEPPASQPAAGLECPRHRGDRRPPRGRPGGAPGWRLAAVFEADFGQRTAQRVLERRLSDERRPMRPRPRWPARSSTRWSPPRRDRRPDRGRRAPATRSSSSPGWTARCSVAPWLRCYTRPRRRPGWPSPSGSSSHAPTVANRCGA